MVLRAPSGATNGPRAGTSQEWLLTHLGIRPTFSTQLLTILAAALDAAERRSPDGITVLDAGCGHTSPLVPFRERIARLVGVDVHPPDRPLPYLDAFVTVDLCAPGGAIEAEAFDMIVSNFTIEHLADPRAAFRNLYGWLRPGGWLVATTVNRRHPFVAAYLNSPARVRRGLQPIVKTRAADAHTLVGACNDPASLRAALEDVGFEAVELQTVRHLARAWKRRFPTFALGLVGDLMVGPDRDRWSTILARARRPEPSAS